MTLTPETLRAQARHHRRYGRNVVASQMDDAAAAWEACELALSERRRVAFDRMGESRKLRKRLEAAETLLTDVRESAVEFRDPRIGYVTVQIDRGTWDALAGEKPNVSV